MSECFAWSWLLGNLTHLPFWCFRINHCIHRLFECPGTFSCKILCVKTNMIWYFLIWQSLMVKECLYMPSLFIYVNLAIITDWIVTVSPWYIYIEKDIDIYDLYKRKDKGFDFTEVICYLVYMLIPFWVLLNSAEGRAFIHGQLANVQFPRNLVAFYGCVLENGSWSLDKTITCFNCKHESASEEFIAVGSQYNMVQSSIILHIIVHLQGYWTLNTQ